MIRVTEHTRRKPGAKCCICRLGISPNDRYRQLVQVGETDIWDSPFGRWMAHVDCALGSEEADSWELTTDRRTRRVREDRMKLRAVATWNETNSGITPVRYWPMLREGEGQFGTTPGPAFLYSAGAPVVHIRDVCTVALTHVAAQP